MSIGPTPLDLSVGTPVRLFSHRGGLCEWHLDGGQIVGENPDGSFWVRWHTPGPKHIVLIQTNPLNGQQTTDERTIIVLGGGE